MVDVQPRLRTPPSSDGEISPPMSPEQKPAKFGAGDVPQLDKRTDRPIDADIEDNYVQRTLAATKPLPPVTLSNFWTELNWLNVALLTIIPAIALYGIATTPLNWKTGLFSVFWYYVTGLGITAGYHRLWAHRAYNASVPLQWLLCFAGSGACEGSIKWWCRGHRAHHRYTDTDLDPYNAHKGFWYSHIGWMLIKPRRKPGVADISDLTRNPIIRWQQKHYLKIMLAMAFLVPTVVPGLLWGDWRGGYFYAGAVRLTFVHHSTFCVNSLAHWLGERPFDDKHTPRDHVLTALATVGEGYHNFHHQFPMDFRNAIKWYQYDPTKWFISVCHLLSLASHLKAFPKNEIRKGQLTMELKRLKADSDELVWPVDADDLPVVSWAAFQEQSKIRPLILISGFIVDVSSFINEHPGGRHLLQKMIGRDATTAFSGGVYEHSNAAHNLLAMMRVGVLEGGMEVEHLKMEHAEAARAAAADLPTPAEEVIAPEVYSSEISPEDAPEGLLRAKTYIPPSQVLQIVDMREERFAAAAHRAQNTSTTMVDQAEIQRRLEKSAYPVSV